MRLVKRSAAAPAAACVPAGLMGEQAVFLRGCAVAAGMGVESERGADIVTSRNDEVPMWYRT